MAKLSLESLTPVLLTFSFTESSLKISEISSDSLADSRLSSPSADFSPSNSADFSLSFSADFSLSNLSVGLSLISPVMC